MNTTVKNSSKYTSTLVASFVIGLTTLTLATGANAAKLSGEQFKEYSAENAYWVVSVDCEDGTPERTIQRKTDGSEWCGKSVEGYCAPTKPAAADKVCAAEYAAVLAERAESELAQKREAEAKAKAERERREREARVAAERQRAAEAKRQNQIKIDERLLEIEQEKLSLRRQELELQRRAVEIREALEDLDK